MTEINFDLLIDLQGAGWSSIRLIINGKIFEYVASHVLSNPIADLIRVATKLDNDVVNEEVSLFEEPDFIKLKISNKPNRQHLINIEIYERGVIAGVNQIGKKYVTEFETKRRIFKTILYFQLLKIEALLKDKQYRDSREEDFPWTEFSEYRRKMESELSGRHPKIFEDK